MIHIPTEYPIPHSPGHEKDVMSALLNYPELLDEYPHLTESHFYLPATKAAWKLIAANPNRKVFDLTTFYEEANTRGLLDALGGPSGVAELMTRPSFPEVMPQHVEKLNFYLARRLAITAGLEIVREAFECDAADSLLEAAGGPITAIHDAVSSIRPTVTTKQVIIESFEAYQQRLKGSSTPMGIPMLPEIDALIRGMHPGRVYVIGAYSGGGKSVLSSQIITLNALDGVPVVEINYEMRERDSMDRKIIQMSRVPSQAFMDPLTYARENDKPAINQDFMRKLATTRDALAKAPIRLVRPPNRQLRTLLSIIRKSVRETGAKIVAIDYLQLVRCKAGSPEAEISEISHSIQEIAQELGIAVLLLSQLNEKGDTKHGIVAVEDCDAYLIIEQERNKEAENFGQHYQILLAKDRHCGNSGKGIPLIFDPNLVRFVHGFVDKRKTKSESPKKKWA